MECVKQAWVWILGLFVALLGVIAWLVYKLMQQDAKAKTARADATESNARRDIELKREKLARLRADMAINSGKIKVVEGEIEEKKAKLNEKFTAQGLSGEEIAERFRRLRL
jgi:hypothetical protein